MVRQITLIFFMFGLAACSASEGKTEKGTPSGDPVCGNGILDPGESCDGLEFGGESCETLGLGAGELACRSNCQAFDRSACGAPETCGSESVESPEVCDGGDLAGATCVSLGYGPGTLGCSANCAEFDVTQCGPLATCGNGQIDDGELCDGSALGGATCESLGARAGTLGCAENCQVFDRTRCSAGCTPECGERECGPDPTCGSSCGSCEEGDMCTADGACVCVPLTCEQVSAQCGTVADGCGGELDCGGCDFPAECGADGMPNICSCPLVADGGTVAVDVPTVEITFDMTVGNQPITTSNTDYNSEGRLEIVDVNTGDRIALPWAYSGRTTPNGLAYPTTRRIVPGVYDIYYDSDSDGSVWPINDNALILENVELRTSKTVDVDIPVVNVTFDLTVGNQALTTANTDYNSEGRLELVDTETRDRIFLPWAYSGRTTQSGFAYPTSRRLVPGTYEIYYDSDSDGRFWPINDNAIIKKGESLLTSKTVDVDIPVVDVTFGLTVGNQSLTASNTDYNSEGRLELVDIETDDRIFLPWAYSGRTSQNGFAYPATRRLIPGDYDVYYDSDSDGRFWPINDNAIIKKGESLLTSKTVNVDVPVVEVTFDLTVDGQMPTTANTDYNSEGRLELVDNETDDRIFLPWAYSGRTSENGFAYPATRRLIPGTYDIYYDSDSNGAFWPINNNAILRDDESLLTSRTVTVDVPAVDLTFDVTVDGQSITSSNTDYNAEGRLELVDTQTGDRIMLPWAYSGRTSQNGLAYPAVRRLIPATYDIYYDSDSNGAFWPINDNALIRSGESLTSSQMVDVDIPAVDLTFGLTVGMQTPDLNNTDYNSEGRLELLDTVTADRIRLPWAYSGRTTQNGLAYPATRRIVPGTYEVYYDSDSNGAFWPINDNAVLTCFTAQ